MVMNVYFVLQFWSDSKDLKREGERSKSKSNFKAMVIVFFDIRGIVHIDWVPRIYNIGTTDASLNHTLPIPLCYRTQKNFQTTRQIFTG
jgi:hypothetical protein